MKTYKSLKAFKIRVNMLEKDEADEQIVDQIVIQERMMSKMKPKADKKIMDKYKNILNELKEMRKFL